MTLESLGRGELESRAALNADDLPRTLARDLHLGHRLTGEVTREPLCLILREELKELRRHVVYRVGAQLRVVGKLRVLRLSLGREVQACSRNRVRCHPSWAFCLIDRLLRLVVADRLPFHLSEDQVNLFLFGNLVVGGSDGLGGALVERLVAEHNELGAGQDRSTGRVGWRSVSDGDNPRALILEVNGHVVALDLHTIICGCNVRSALWDGKCRPTVTVGDSGLKTEAPTRSSSDLLAGVDPCPRLPLAPQAKLGGVVDGILQRHAVEQALILWDKGNQELILSVQLDDPPGTGRHFKRVLVVVERRLAKQAHIRDLHRLRQGDLSVNESKLSGGKVLSFGRPQLVGLRHGLRSEVRNESRNDGSAADGEGGHRGHRSDARSCAHACCVHIRRFLPRKGGIPNGTLLLDAEKRA